MNELTEVTPTTGPAPDVNYRLRIYQQMTRKTKPLDPATLDQRALLVTLGFSKKTASALLARANGDIFNLSGQQDAFDLEALPGMGPMNLLRLVSLFALIHHYERWLEQGLDNPASVE